MSLKRRAAGLSWRTLAKAACFITLLVAANILTHWLADALTIQIRPSNEDLVHRTIMIAAISYALLLAIPFVPGAEVGLALIAMFGPPIAFLVYVCTFAGLSISFLVGRLIPLTGLIRLTESVDLQRVSHLLQEMEPLDQRERLLVLANKAPNRFLPFLLRHRYIVLGIALNIPGNFVIGGGGGIALLAGVSRVYSVPGFLVAMAIAVSPIPLAILIFGSEFLTD